MVDDSASPAGEDLTLQPVAVGSRPRRRALWGVLAVAAIAAGVLAVSSGSDGPPRLPVALGSSAGREAAGAQSADMALAWVTYVPGDGLPMLGGKATAYRLSGTIDAARVKALAAALGMSGEPTRSDKTWHLESGTAVLDVSEDAGGMWWYNADQRVQGISSSGGGSAGCDPAATECAVAGDEGSATDEPATTVPGDTCSSDGSECSTTVPECPPNADCAAPVEPCGPAVDCIVPPPTTPVPPADLPTKEEARKIALDLVAATGVDVDAANVTIDGPYDAWYVSVEPLLDGVPISGIGASVSVGSKGAITNASGTLGTPEPLGEYPLLDTRAAIDRLNKLQEGGYGGGPVPLGAPDGVARDLGVATAEESAPGCAADDASCVGDPVAPTTTVVGACKTQPDGREICEPTAVPPDQCLTIATDSGGATEPGSAGCVAPPAPCIVAEPPVDTTAETTETTAAPEPCVEPAPYPEPGSEPEPVEVTLTDAVHVLTVLYSSDGAGDVYLVPGYRFTAKDSGIVEVAAVDDDSLAPTTTAPETTASSAVTPPPVNCEVAVEGDASGTTHTVQTCPSQPVEPVEPATLEPGQSPEVGVGYYVDVNVVSHCWWISAEVGGRWWWAQMTEEELASWSTPTEGGTFTLVDPDNAEFVGDAARTKVAKLVQYRDGTSPPMCA
ncbi:MAG: hypothetical protein ACT4OV_12290 [Microthrixaceae bacterium]